MSEPAIFVMGQWKTPGADGVVIDTNPKFYCSICGERLLHPGDDGATFMEPSPSGCKSAWQHYACRNEATIEVARPFNEAQYRERVADKILRMQAQREANERVG